MTVITIWLVLGLGLGFGVAFAIRRFLPAWRRRRQTDAPPVHASRQALRKARREQQKKAQSARRSE
jgi:predicted signal transduction protein with EAL and GGDEF domain